MRVLQEESVIETGKWYWIKWRDHCSNDTSWHDMEDSKVDYMTPETMGYCVATDDKAIKLSMNIHKESEQYSMAMSILLSDVIEYAEIK